MQARTSEAAEQGLTNGFAFHIETIDGRALAATPDGIVAYAMFRAAVDEYAGCPVRLTRNGEVLAERC